MSEQAPLSPEELKKIEDAALIAQYADMLDFCEKPKTPTAELKDCEPEIIKLEQMIASFESAHPVAELLLITHLTRKEAEEHPVREPAKLALIPILNQLYFLRDKTNIAPEKYQDLDEKYKRLSRAVGTLSKNGVDHNI